MVMLGGLEKFVFEDVDFFCSPEIVEEFCDYGGQDHYFVSIIDSFNRNTIHKEISQLYARILGIDKRAVLSAHGNSYNGKWVYNSSGKYFLIQDWINEMDGKYSSLMIHSCNPGNCSIFSSISPVIAFNDVYSILRLDDCQGQMELYVPGVGYVDSYIEEYELDRIRDLERKINTIN